MTDIPESVQLDIARSRWRADLLRMHADEYRSLIGENTSAAATSITETADNKVAEADLHIVGAQLQLEHAQAKVAFYADPKNDKLRKAYQQASQEWADALSTWRGIGEAVGGERFVQSVDDFPEPSDEEVLATHGTEA